MATRYSIESLRTCAAALMTATGFPGEVAAIVAERLVDADAMGHDTHGLQLLGPYLDDAAAGRMTLEGEPEVIADRPAAVTWDGRRLSGVWLTEMAVGLAIERARACGQATVAIRRSHHIACLATFLPTATRAGMMVTIASSDPAVVSVAPHGGTKPLYTPNPIAVGIPTKGDPILIDISASITTNGMSGRLAAAGRRMPYTAYLDAEGRPSDDPAVTLADPPGSILPIGGVEYGHKGFGLALMIEALTQGLSGYGRSQAPAEWGASVAVTVTDPAAFAGFDAFVRETGWLAEAARANPPRAGIERVRLPGEAGLARRRRAEKEGVALHPGIMEAMAARARDRGIAVPEPV